MPLHRTGINRVLARCFVGVGLRAGNIHSGAQLDTARLGGIANGSGPSHSLLDLGRKACSAH